VFGERAWSQILNDDVSGVGKREKGITTFIGGDVEDDAALTSPAT
jgi:hypothetical protein